MNAKNLQQATVHLAHIHELDRVIIELDKKAVELANGTEFKDIVLSFEKPESEEDKKEEMEDYMFPSALSYIMGGPPRMKPKKDTADRFRITITAYESLFVLGALISVIKDKRKALCDEIVKLGVTL